MRGLMSTNTPAAHPAAISAFRNPEIRPMRRPSKARTTTAPVEKEAEAVLPGDRDPGL